MTAFWLILSTFLYKKIYLDIGHYVTYISKKSWCAYVVSQALPSETQFKLKSYELLFGFHWYLSCPNLLQYCTDHMAAILPCSVQNFKMIRGLFWLLWKNKISWDLSLKWVLEEYLVLRQLCGWLWHVYWHIPNEPWISDHQQILHFLQWLPLYHRILLVLALLLLTEVN